MLIIMTPLSICVFFATLPLSPKLDSFIYSFSENVMRCKLESLHRCYHGDHCIRIVIFNVNFCDGWDIVNVVNSLFF